MRVWSLGIALISFLLYGCGTKEINADVPVGNEIVEISQKSEVQFPDRIKLNFSDVVTTEWNQKIDTTEWSFYSTHPFGVLTEELIFLDIYEDESNAVHGILKTANQDYKILYIGYDPNVELNIIQHIYKRGENNILLFGTIQSGLTQYYVIYDENSKEWSIFNGWEKPVYADINDDGILDIIEEIAHHSNFDVLIMKWNGENFEETSIGSNITNQLDEDLPIIKILVSYTYHNNSLKFHVSFVTENANGDFPTATYSYINEELVLDH